MFRVYMIYVEKYIIFLIEFVLNIEDLFKCEEVFKKFLEF